MLEGLRNAGRITECWKDYGMLEGLRNARRITECWKDGINNSLALKTLFFNSSEQSAFEQCGIGAIQIVRLD